MPSTTRRESFASVATRMSAITSRISPRIAPSAGSMHSSNSGLSSISTVHFAFTRSSSGRFESNAGSDSVLSSPPIRNFKLASRARSTRGRFFSTAKTNASHNGSSGVVAMMPSCHGSPSTCTFGKRAAALKFAHAVSSGGSAATCRL